MCATKLYQKTRRTKYQKKPKLLPEEVVRLKPRLDGRLRRLPARFARAERTVGRAWWVWRRRWTRAWTRTGSRRRLRAESVQFRGMVFRLPCTVSRDQLCFVGCFASETWLPSPSRGVAEFLHCKRTCADARMIGTRVASRHNKHQNCSGQHGIQHNVSRLTQGRGAAVAAGFGGFQIN